MANPHTRNLTIATCLIGSLQLMGQGTVAPTKVVDLAPMATTNPFSMRACGTGNARICYSTYTTFGNQGSTSAIYSTDGTPGTAVLHKELEATMKVVQTDGDAIYYGTGHGFGGYYFDYGATSVNAAAVTVTPRLETTVQITPKPELRPQVVNGKLVCATNWSTAAGVEPVSVLPDGSKSLIKDLEPGTGSSCASTGSGSTCVAGGRMFFPAYTTATGLELWATDGTAAGTQQISNFTSAAQPSFTTNNLTAIGNRVYMSGNDGSTDVEPWTYNTANGSLTKLKDIAIGTTQGSDPREFIQLGKSVLFTADDKIRGRQLWITDGTTAGTRLVKDAGIGKVNAAEAHNPTVCNNKVYYFTTNSQTKAVNLYRTDGTAAGTALCHTIGTGGTIYGTAATNGRLYYVLASSDGRTTLWRTDGTTAGNQEVKPGGASAPRPLKLMDLVAKGSTLYFMADYTGGGTSLWKITDPLVIPTVPPLPTR